MLLMIFLFSGCMAVAPESIAGEKERGTIATLLVTPIKRSHLAIGKIISLSVIAILSGLSSFLGTMLSLPKLMGGDESVNASVYGIGDYILTLLIILSTVLVIITLVSIISAFAKNVKEATGWVTPVMIISMLLGVTSMVESLCMTEPVWFLIPLYNSVQSMNGIFSMEPDLVNIGVTVVANVVFAGLGAFVLAKMFDNQSRSLRIVLRITDAQTLFCLIRLGESKSACLLCQVQLSRTIRRQGSSSRTISECPCSLRSQSRLNAK